MKFITRTHLNKINLYQNANKERKCKNLHILFIFYLYFEIISNLQKSWNSNSEAFFPDPFEYKMLHYPWIPRRIFLRNKGILHEKSITMKKLILIHQSLPFNPQCLHHSLSICLLSAQDALGSSCNIPTLALGSVCSKESFLYREWYLEPKIWIVVLFVILGATVLRPFQYIVRKCVCVCVCVCVYVHIGIYVYICV